MFILETLKRVVNSKRLDMFAYQSKRNLYIATAYIILIDNVWTRNKAYLMIGRKGYPKARFTYLYDINYFMRVPTTYGSFVQKELFPA